MRTGRRPAKAPWWLFVLAVVAAWLLGAELAIFTAVGRDLPARLPGLAVWTFVALCVGFLAVAGRRELTSERQTARLIAQLKQALGSFGMLTETSLAALPLDELLQQLLERLCEVLEADVAVVMVGDQRALSVRASHGLDVEPLEPFAVETGDGLIGSVMAGRVPRSADDAGQLNALASQLRHPLVSAAAGPILVEGRLLGVCVVGSSKPGRFDGRHRFDDRHLQLLQLVADRAGVEIDRARLGEAQVRSRADADRVRSHAVVLARASEVLLSAKDDEDDSLLALADVVVGDFADVCAVELNEAGGGTRTLRRGAGGFTRPTGQAEGWMEAPAAATTGSGPIGALGSSADHWLSPDHRTVTVAVAVGGSVFGTLAVARDERKPTYEETDVAVVVELGARAAVAVERAQRYRGAREEARAAKRRASQLHQLVRASIEVQQLGREPDILAMVTERARQVFDAPTAVMTAELDGAGPLQAVARASEATVWRRPEQEALVDIPSRAATATGPWRAEGWFGTPMAGREGNLGGSVAIRSPQGDGNEDDESVLVLLAQMASRALDNALLTQSIQASEGRWRVLVEAAPIGIVEVDLSGQVQWWNRAAEALFAWPPAPARPAPERRSPGPSFSPPTAAWLGTVWSEVRDGAEVIDRELKVTSPDGDLRELAVSAAPLRSSEGALHGILTLVADVTDRRRLEAQLRRAQRMEAIGILAGGVAHDFNNLLTLITGYTELLKRRVSEDQRSVEFADGIRTAAIRASLLTGQLLTISKSQTAHRVVLAPADALNSAAEVLQGILGADITVRWALDLDAGEVSIDPRQLEQVILNLATNARDAMAGAGQVDIGVMSTQLDRAGSDALGLAPGRYIRISVADTGKGMDAETRRRCFEPFYSTKGPASGTGLGLAAVRGVVAESGGAIDVESEPHGGATFTIYLPAVDEADELEAEGLEAEDLEPTTPELESGRPRDRDPRTVLVADDDNVLLQLMSRTLSRAGYRVLEASGGGEAISVAAGWCGPIDALVSDVVMPDVTGPDVAAKLGVDRPTMRVLFISGGMGAALLAGMPRDPQRFLAKPFKPSQLVVRVRDLLADERTS